MFLNSQRIQLRFQCLIVFPVQLQVNYSIDIQIFQAGKLLFQLCPLLLEISYRPTGCGDLLQIASKSPQFLINILQKIFLDRKSVV